MLLGCRSFETTTKAVASKKFSFHVSGEGKSLVYARKKKKKISSLLPSQVVCAYRYCRVYTSASHSDDRTFSPPGKKGRKSFIAFLKNLLSPPFSLRRFLTQIHIWYHYVLPYNNKISQISTLWDVPNTAYIMKLNFS